MIRCMRWGLKAWEGSAGSGYLDGGRARSRQSIRSGPRVVPASGPGIVMRLRDRLIAVLLAQSRAGEQQQLYPLEFVEHLAQHRADRVGRRFRHHRHTSIG